MSANRRSSHWTGVLQNGWDRLSSWFLNERHGTYGLAIMRIGFGAMTVIILAMYLPNFSYSFGAGSRWGTALTQSSAVHDYLWPIPLLFPADEPDGLRLAKILLLMVVAVVYALGWRMRVTSPVFVLLWLGFTLTNPVILNTGHYQTFRIFLLFMLLADLSQRWSLDARRRNRRGIEDHALGIREWRLPRWVPILANNVALALIGYQICIIYVSSALWKLQGLTWVSGVAAYYPLQLEELTLFPWLNHLAWQVTPAVLIASWLAVYGQLFFPVLLLNRWTRILGLVLVTGMHAGIGILLALPWFSLMMILGDMIFIRDRSWRALTRRLARAAPTNARRDSGSRKSGAGQERTRRLETHQRLNHMHFR